MAIPLSEVLEHPSLAAADPVLRAGKASTNRLVRWVHSSEVFDIATLLQGGELLLTGGVVLAQASAEGQRSYIGALARRGVTGIAIETGGHPLTALSDVLAQEAERWELPLIELRRVVRFVDVTEAINSIVLNQSVSRLRFADSISHTLSSLLASGGDLQGLVTQLGRLVRADVVLAEKSGETLAASTSSQGHEPPDPPLSGGGATTGVFVHGVHVATLVVHPSTASEQAAVDAAMERAPEVLSLAMLQQRPPSPDERAAHELLRLLTEGTTTGPSVQRLAEMNGLTARTPAVSAVARANGRPPVSAGEMEAVFQHRGRAVTLAWLDDGLHAISSLPQGGDRDARATLLQDLREQRHRFRGYTVALGPAATGVDGAARSLAEARTCLALQQAGVAEEVILDADELAIERLFNSFGDIDALRYFVDEQIGDLVAADGRHGSSLVATLDTYLTEGCSKTRAARALHIQRQSLYQRLERIRSLLGGDPGDPARILTLHLATRLRHFVMSEASR